MNAAEINIDCLRAAEAQLRRHDALISETADLIRKANAELKQLHKDRLPLAERSQYCIDVLCGRATPDLFAHPPAEVPGVPVSEPVVVTGLPTPPDVTPPLAPGEVVPIDVLKATPIADIAAIQDDAELAAVAAKLAGVEFEVVTVGELWEWADADFEHWGGFGGAAQCGIVGALSVATVAVATARRFGIVLEGWLEANGMRLTDDGWVSAADVPTTPAKVKKIAAREASELEPADDAPPADHNPNALTVPKGEPIEPLGIRLEDLEAATHLGVADYGVELTVKPVAVNGRRHVVAGMVFGGQVYRTYDVLPLYTLAEFSRKHPGISMYSTLTPPDPKGRGGRAPGEYGGLMVTVGRGKSKEVLVVGPKNEQRRLLWVKTVNPYDVPPPKAKKKPAASKPKSKGKVKA